MKYSIMTYTSFDENFWNVITTTDDEVFTSFPAEMGNPNYDAFLTQVDLTDEEVRALPVDEWFEV